MVRHYIPAWSNAVGTYQDDGQNERSCYQLWKVTYVLYMWPTTNSWMARNAHSLTPYVPVNWHKEAESMSSQTVPQLVACCNFMLLHNMGQSVHHQVRFLKTTPIVKTHLLYRKPADPSGLNFTLGQLQSFTEHLQRSITSSWPFAFPSLLLVLLRQSGASLKGTAARLSQTRPNTCGHLT